MLKESIIHITKDDYSNNTKRKDRIFYNYNLVPKKNKVVKYKWMNITLIQL